MGPSSSEEPVWGQVAGLKVGAEGDELSLLTTQDALSWNLLLNLPDF